MENRICLDDVVIVNENDDEQRAGDVTVFRSAHDAVTYLEHWWVEEGYGSARSASGDRLILAVDDAKDIFVERREPCPTGAVIVRVWLHSAAEAKLAARRAQARKLWSRVVLSEAEEAGVLPQSVDELIDYIGFKS